MTAAQPPSEPRIAQQPVADPPTALRPPAAQPSAQQPTAARENAQPSQPRLTPAEDPDLALLRRDFQSLQEALAADPPPAAEALQSLLDGCLRSRALETIAVSLAFEDALAGVLWMHRTRADALIERAVTHFGWREARRRQGPSLALAAYADRVRPLREARSKAPRAYHALTRPPRASLLWWRILRYRVDLDAHPVWTSLSAVGTALPATVSREALEWWGRYFQRPHPQPLLLRLAGLLAVLGGIIGLAVGSDSARAGQGALIGCVAGALTGIALTVAYLAAVDWPRHWLKERHRATTRLGRLAWLPATAGLCLLAGVAPDTVLTRTVIGLLAGVVFLWAVIVTPEAGLAGPEKIAQRLWGKLLVNVPLGAWWVVLSGGKTSFPSLLMRWSLIAAAGAFAFGLPALFLEYRRTMTAAAQRTVRLAIAVFSAVIGAVLVLRPIDPPWRGPLLMGMAIIVLLQRVPTLTLTPWQLRLRYYLTVPTSLVLLGPASQSGVLTPFRLSGALFMGGVVIAMLACEYGEWLNWWRETRGAPVLKARLWRCRSGFRRAPVLDSPPPWNRILNRAAASGGTGRSSVCPSRSPPYPGRTCSIRWPRF